MRHPIGFVLFLFCLPAIAQVYKWVDENGVVHYTDQPPAKNVTPADLPPIQTYKGGTLPKLDQYAEPAAKAAPPPTVTITSPSPDHTFRGESQGRVEVSVAVSPPLADDQKFLYYLDGAAQGGPTGALSQTFHDVERGQHSVAVAVVDGSGKELSRSGPVTVHMKFPGGG